MARSNKRLGKAVLDTNVTEIFNGSGSGTASSVEAKSIKIVNTNTTTSRKITLYSHGNTTADISWIQTLQAGESILFGLDEENPIFVGVSDKFYAKQDVGNDVNIVVYGIEVV